MNKQEYDLYSKEIKEDLVRIKQDLENIKHIAFQLETLLTISQCVVVVKKVSEENIEALNSLN